MTAYEIVLSFLASLAAEPGAVDAEAPRAAAACQAAYASFSVDAPQPPPAPKPGECCGECKGTGVIVHGDGHRTPCACPSSCKCKSKQAAPCPGGKCPTLGR